LQGVVHFATASILAGRYRDDHMDREHSSSVPTLQQSSLPRGLSEDEARRRLVSFGYNELVEKRPNPFLKFLSYFWGPIPWMIEAAALLSALIRRWEDFSVISVLLVINAAVGFWHEHKAGVAVEALKRRLAPKARVLRDGVWKVVEARLLVPGDVVRIRLGDIVPADVKLLGDGYLLVDQSALTGESLPVERRGGESAYSGSIVRIGEADCVVVATGMNTYFGRTARLVEEAETESHFQKAVMGIGKYLIAVALVLVGVVLVVALARHEGGVEILQFALVLAVASIPAALPAVLSVTMAVGATALAGRGAIVSRLAAVEEMAGVDVLCTDKTGTVTRNELQVAALAPLEGYTEDDVLLYARLASREEDGDPIDTAVLAAAAARGVTTDPRAHGYKVERFKPFDPVTKKTEAEIRGADGVFRVAKGAPQAVTSLLEKACSPLTAQIDSIVDGFASDGYRSLAVARTDSSGRWHVVGLIALHDPPREDSAATLHTARRMGVAVKLVTGDHTAVARHVASLVGLGTNIVPAGAFLDKPPREMDRVVAEADGFSEVFPEHKYTIVDILQRQGHIVGMTGDGVNDAPALRKADAGIAVAGATDAARAAADIVLTRGGLSVLIDAIRLSREIFRRMNNYALYRIAETIRVLLFITLSIVLLGFYPVTAVMIVLLALLNDLPIMTISLDNVPWSQRPERWDMAGLLALSTVLGLLGVVSSFGLLFIGDKVLHLGRPELQSLVYLKLSVAGHMMLFVARTRGPFWSTRPAGALLAATVATQFVATLIVVFGFILPPIGWRLALFVWLYSLGWFLINDAVKVVVCRLTGWMDGGSSDVSPVAESG